MDPLSDLSSAIPSVLDDPFSAASQAQQLLQSAGWTYYTIWRKNTPQNPLLSNSAPGLVWSQGDVNRSLHMPDQNNAYAASSELITSTHEYSQQLSKACKMGCLLQQFYKHCTFLPLGLGVAGMAMTSGRYQWSNTREEIFKQMCSLSTCNQQHLPTDLQEGFFETMVCIPLQNGAGVLEMGTNALVPESEGMLQMLWWTEGLATGCIHREREQERFLNPALNSTSAFTSARHNPGPSIEHREFIRQEHNVDILKAMMYGGRDLSSMSSSSSSAVSSPPSADHQRGSTVLGFSTPSPIPSMSDEDMLTASTPAPTSLAATSLAVSKSINQLDILNQLGHIELQYTGGGSPSFEPAFADHELLNPSIAQYQPGAASQLCNASFMDDSYSSDPACFCSTTHVASSTVLPSHLAHQHDTLYHPQHAHLHHGNQQDQYQWFTRKMIDCLSGEATVHEELVSTQSPSMLLMPGKRSRAGKEKDMETQGAAAMVEAESSTSHVNKGQWDLSNSSGGLNVASMRSDKPFHNQGDQLLVGFSTEILTKPASGRSFDRFISAGSVARGDDQYTPRNMQQGEAKGHNSNNLQLGALKDHYINMQLKSAWGCFINKPQRAAGTYDFINMHQEHTAGSGDDRHIKLGRYAGMGSAAAKVLRSRHGAFKSWRRSLCAVTCRKKQTQTARSDSFLKKFLVHYLPRQQQIRKARVWIEHGIETGPSESLIGYVQDLSSLPQLISQGKEAAQVTADDHESPSQPELAAVNHKIAERNRRRKHAECYEALRNLVPDIAKKDKVTLLEHSIRYLNEVKDRVLELHKEKAALMLIDNEDNRDALTRSSIHTNSQAIASCLCLPSSMFKDGNYFHMKVEKLSINHEDINMANIDIISALQRKNLHCIKFKLELEKNTQKVDIEILAKYKDGDNCSLSLDGIQEIKDWWPTFAKNFEIDKP